MAFFDRERNAIVLRVVYDGAAGAGKTSSVRALGRSLGRPVTTPEEAGERTLFFDWLDYTGGLFDGYPLRCQVLTVPGQAILARRRLALLETADVIVYVAEVTSASMGALTRSLGSLPTHNGGVPLGVVVQANKRDLPDALPLPVIRAALASSGRNAAVVETNALIGDGVREAFVFAIRLALDRVREQATAGTLETQRPVDDPAALYEQMRATSEEPAADSPPPSVTSDLGRVPLAAGAPSAPMAHRPTDQREEIPIAPTRLVPAGLVWPPVDGRVHLSDATATELTVERVGGGWGASSDDGWKLHSPTSAVFEELEDGRDALIHWARIHSQHSTFLSSPRCIALASDGHGCWRLWQVLRMRPSLRDRLASHLGETRPAVVAEALLDAASRLTEAHHRVRSAAVPLALSLDSIGVWGRETTFVGLVPRNAMAADEISLAELLAPAVQDWSHLGDELVKALGVLRFRAHDFATRDAAGLLLGLLDSRDPD